MLKRFAVKFAQFLLKQDLSQDLKLKLMTSILENLHALPFRDIIVVDDSGKLLVNNRQLDIEQTIQLQESARSALQSVALKVINDQVSFNAITLGVHKVERPEQMVFSRAAIWWGQQQLQLLKLLAGDTGTSPDIEA